MLNTILHTITVRNRQIVSVDPVRFVQNNVNFDALVLDLDEAWDGLATIFVTVRSSKADEPLSLLYTVGEPLVLPKSYLEDLSVLSFSVTGYGPDNTARIVTEAMTDTSIFGRVYLSGDVAFEGQEPEDVNPDIWAQLTDLVREVSANEPERVKTEAERVAAEQQRVLAENAREIAEAERSNEWASAKTDISVTTQAAKTATDEAKQAAEDAREAAYEVGEKSLYAYADPEHSDQLILEYPAFLQSEDGGSVYLTLEGSDTNG